MVCIETEKGLQHGILTPETGAVEQFLTHFQVSEEHWGYQPYREHAYRLPQGEVRRVFDISGKDQQLFVWDDVNKPVRGFNALITEECHRPLAYGVEGTILKPVFPQPEFGFQLSPSYGDWLQAYDPTLYEDIRQILYTKAEFATTPTQHILTLLPSRMADIQVELGIRMYKEDYPERPGPIGFWPAELAVKSDTDESEGTIDVLARHGIAVLTLRDDQLDTHNVDAPLYMIETRRGNHMFVIPFSSSISGLYAFSRMNADEFRERILWNGQANGVNRIGANDLETFTNRKGVGYLDFTHWLYNIYLPEYRNEGKVIWRRHSDMAVPADLKPVTSWSCIHGDGRWSGDPACGCDGSTPEEQPGKQAEKRGLMNGLNEELAVCIDTLDELSVKTGTAWESEYIDWQMTIRKNLAAGKIISADTVRAEFRLHFLRIHNAMMGLQSCAFFFSGDYERQMARASLAEASYLRNPHEQIIFSMS